MYYLRKEPVEMLFLDKIGPDGTVIPERRNFTEDRAIYKSRSSSRFYRHRFLGMNDNPVGMKLYTCKKLKTILELRNSTHDYCGEWFDVYDENGKVDLSADSCEVPE